MTDPEQARWGGSIVAAFSMALGQLMILTSRNPETAWVSFWSIALIGVVVITAFAFRSTYLRGKRARDRELEKEAADADEA